MKNTTKKLLIKSLKQFLKMTFNFELVKLNFLRLIDLLDHKLKEQALIK